MACIENVLGGHAPSPLVVAVDKNGNQELHHDMPLQCLSSKPEDDTEPWGLPQVSLRPSINVLTDLASEQPECPSERIGSCIPVHSLRALRHPYGPPPAVAEESLATAEVNSSDALAGWRQEGQDAINVSWEVSGGPPALIVGGTKVNNGGTERGSNNARLYVALPQGKGFFSPRGPQVRGPSHIPTLRSGIVMEVSPRNTQIACRGKLAHVSFPLGGPCHPMHNWPRPIPLSSSTLGLPSCSTAHCFIPPRPPIFNPFIAMPLPFAPPPIFHPPLPSYFVHFHSGGMPAPASPNREHS
ncbi:PREDICTED: proline-rich protein 32 [Rhinopithecus bieti]|uniref:proline-rich protein 32 n=1 Tax=Rhinopithecus bieti TaxID=61621 RepID=UPI00083C7363|nr:PREDICTED: proline-rich protein 32 [Rhinopithecus bieti]